MAIILNGDEIPDDHLEIIRTNPPEEATLEDDLGTLLTRLTKLIPAKAKGHVLASVCTQAGFPGCNATHFARLRSFWEGNKNEWKLLNEQVFMPAYMAERCTQLIRPSLNSTTANVIYRLLPSSLKKKGQLEVFSMFTRWLDPTSNIQQEFRHHLFTALSTYLRKFHENVGKVLFTQLRWTQLSLAEKQMLTNVNLTTITPKTKTTPKDKDDGEEDETKAKEKEKETFLAILPAFDGNSEAEMWSNLVIKLGQLLEGKSPVKTAPVQKKGRNAQGKKRAISESKIQSKKRFSDGDETAGKEKEDAQSATVFDNEELNSTSTNNPNANCSIEVPVAKECNVLIVNGSVFDEEILARLRRLVDSKIPQSDPSLEPAQQKSLLICVDMPCLLGNHAWDTTSFSCPEIEKKIMDEEGVADPNITAHELPTNRLDLIRNITAHELSKKCLDVIRTLADGKNAMVLIFCPRSQWVFYESILVESIKYDWVKHKSFGVAVREGTAFHHVVQVLRTHSTRYRVRARSERGSFSNSCREL